MFINTLPIIFTYTGLFSSAEAVLFLGSLFLLVYLYTPHIDALWVDKPNPGWYLFLHSAWLGKAALGQVFWPFFFLVNAVFYYIDYRVTNLTYTIASWKTVHGMVFLPIVWWIASVWRCSANTQHKIWSSAARTLTLCLVIEIILRFFITVQYPHTFFDCRLLVVEYGDCR